MALPIFPTPFFSLELAGQVDKPSHDLGEVLSKTSSGRGIQSEGVTD